jgi:hypothetical protein
MSAFPGSPCLLKGVSTVDGFVCPMSSSTLFTILGCRHTRSEFFYLT